MTINEVRELARDKYYQYNKAAEILHSGRVYTRFAPQSHVQVNRFLAEVSNLVINSGK